MVNQTFLLALKNNGLSITETRAKLFNLLNNQQEPLTMHRLIALAAPELDRSTVYRTIDVFEKIGIIQKIYSGWKYRIELSESYSTHHHHLTCTQCGNIISFEESRSFEKELAKIAATHNFTITTHSFELKGLCSNCN